MHDPKTWIIVIIPILVIFVGSIIWASISDAIIRKKRREQYGKMKGRAKGDISNFKMHRKVRYRNGEKDYRYTARMNYEFEVDGKIYKGEGIGSGALWQRKQQVICYDPDNPEDNCTKYYYDRMMGKDSFIMVLVALMTFVFIFGFVFYFFFKVKGIDINDFLDFLRDYFHF